MLADNVEFWEIICNQLFLFFVFDPIGQVLTVISHKREVYGENGLHFWQDK